MKTLIAVSTGRIVFKLYSQLYSVTIAVWNSVGNGCSDPAGRKPYPITRNAINAMTQTAFVSVEDTKF